MTDYFTYAITTKISAPSTARIPNALKTLLPKHPVLPIFHPLEKKLPEWIERRLAGKAIINVLIILVRFEPKLIGIGKKYQAKEQEDEDKSEGRMGHRIFCHGGFKFYLVCRRDLCGKRSFRQEFLCASRYHQLRNCQNHCHAACNLLGGIGPRASCDACGYASFFANGDDSVNHLLNFLVIWTIGEPHIQG